MKLGNMQHEMGYGSSIANHVRLPMSRMLNQLLHHPPSRPVVSKMPHWCGATPPLKKWTYPPFPKPRPLT